MVAGFQQDEKVWED